MDDEQLRTDLAEAIGKGTAAICIQSALMGMLVAKQVISPEDAATIAGLAQRALEQLTELSPEGRYMADSALRGFARTWTKNVKRN
jgi:hypothetical protein